MVLKDNRILTIDLKDRKMEDSIIIDIEEELEATLDLNLDSGVRELMECISSRDFKKGEGIINRYKYAYTYNAINKLNNDKVVEFKVIRKALNLFKKSCRHLEGKESIVNYCDLKSSLKELRRLEAFNDISSIEKTHRELIEDILIKLQNYDMATILGQLKLKVENHENILEVIKEIDMLADNITYFNDNKDIVEELITKVKDIRTNAIECYNQHINTEDNIKLLLRNKYKDILSENNYQEQLKGFKPFYNSYEEFLVDVSEIHKFFLLNNSKSFLEFYNNIISLHVTDLINLTSYLREYVTRRIYGMKTKFYSIDEVTDTIDNIVSNLEIKNNSKVIPLA